MTIDLSILLWTIADFIILMLVLDRLLFRPLGKVIDKREKKLSAFANAAEAKQRSAEEAREAALQLAAENERKLKNRTKEELAALSAERKTALKNFRKHSEETVTSAKTRLAAEGEEIVTGFDDTAKQFAMRFAEKLTSDKG